MRSILKLTSAGIRRGRGAFKSIILLMMLITFSFSGTVSNADRLREARTERFAQAGVPDIMVSIYDDLLTDEMLRAVEEDPNVQDYCLKQSIFLMKTPQADDQEVKITLTLFPHTDDLNVFSDNGDRFLEDNSLSDGEIFLPYKMKMTKEFQKGTVIKIQTRNGFSESFTVKGYYEDVIQGVTTSAGNYCIITQNDYDRIAAEYADSLFDSDRYAVVMSHLYINGTGSCSQSELRRELGERSPLISSANMAVTREMLAAHVEIFSNIGTRIIAVFVLLLLIVVLITMHNSIRSSIEMDQAELGILKSQGFTAFQISLVYVFQYAAALVIGAILGIAVSVPACRYLISMWKNLTGIMSGTNVSILKCAVLSIAIILICTVFIFISTSKIGRISPVRAIAGAKSEVYFDSRLNTRVRKKPLSFFLALRQLNSRRKSYLGTVFIVMLLSFFVISIMIITKGLDMEQMLTDITGEISLNSISGFCMDDFTEAEAAIREIDGGAELLTESYHRMLVERELIAVHAYNSTEDVFKPLKGRAPKYDNEIMLTESASKSTGKQIGDTLTVTYMDKKCEFIVTGSFQTVWEFGLLTAMTPEGMQRLGYGDIDGAFVSLSDPNKQQQVIDLLNDRYAGKLHAEPYTENSTLETYKKTANILMGSLSYAIYAVLLLFAAVIVAMVCKRTFIRERTDIGIFKAVGFTVPSLRLQFSLRFLLIALLGSAAGCAAGMLWSRKMISYILRIIGLTDFTADYMPAMFIVPSAILCGCFFLTAWFASHRIQTVNVRDLVTE